MNSVFPELDQISSARQQHENSVLCKKNPEYEKRKYEYIAKSKTDRKTLFCLSQNELVILNDKIQNFSRIELEKRSTDLRNQKLPFDFDYDKQIRKKEQQVNLSQTLHSLKTSVPLRSSKKQKFTTLQEIIISPDGYAKLSWDFMCMFLIFYEILSIPFKISFDQEISVQFGIFIDVAFLLDILITFNTAIYKHGIIQYDHKLIALTYLKVWFWIDLIASFPYEYVVDAVVTGDATAGIESDVDQTKTNLATSAQILKLLRFFRFIKIIRLLRLAKLKVIQDKIEEYFQAYTTLVTIVSFLKLSFFVLFWSHWLGCIFHYIAMNEDPEDNWLLTFGIYDMDWSIKYVNSIYWAVTTMITVGYGDISPQTPIERLFGIFFLLVACGVFSFTMNTIGNTMQQLNQKRDMYQKRIADINKYMNKVKIPKQLQNQIRKYLHYMWDSNRTIDLNGICVNLSQILRYELTIQVVGSVLAYYPFMCKIFHREFLIELTQIFQEQTIQPDEYIFTENDPKNLNKLYFIQEGTIKILLIKTGQILILKQKQEIFGEINFFADVQRTASAKSEGFSNLFFVERTGFLELLKKFPNDLQKFYQIQIELTHGEFQVLHIHCYSCDLPGHVAKDCPSLHFVVDPYVFIKTKNRCLREVMRQFIRKDRKAFHSWLDKIQIQKAVKEAQNTIPMSSYLAEECNIEELPTKSIEQNSIPSGFILKSKFKEDRNRKRQMQKVLKSQNQKITEIHRRQSEMINVTKELSQAIISNQTIIESREISNSSDDNESDIVKQKFNELLMQYKLYKSEVNKYNGNPQSEQQQQYTLLNDFEKGTDYEIFNTHNNLSVVIKELKKYNFGVEVKPRIETEFEPHVFEEYVEYYVIDMQEIQRFQLEVQQSQLQQYLPYTTLTMYRNTRQSKKPVIPKKPIQRLKLAIKKVSALKQIIQMK